MASIQDDFYYFALYSTVLISICSAIIMSADTSGLSPENQEAERVDSQIDTLTDNLNATTLSDNDSIPGIHGYVYVCTHFTESDIIMQA